MNCAWRERERERERERDGEAMSSSGRANLLVQVHCLSLKSPLLPSPLSIRQCIRLDHAAISFFHVIFSRIQSVYIIIYICSLRKGKERRRKGEREREKENLTKDLMRYAACLPKWF